MYAMPGQADAQLQPPALKNDQPGDHELNTSAEYQYNPAYESVESAYNDVDVRKLMDVSPSVPNRETLGSQRLMTYPTAEQTDVRLPPAIARKRKWPSDSPETSTVSKRILPTRPASTSSQGLSLYTYGYAGLAYPYDLQTIDERSLPQGNLTYTIPQGQQSIQDARQDTPMANLHSHRSDPHLLMRPPMAQTSSYSPLMSTSQTSHGPGLRSATSFQQSSSSSPSLTNPSLVRVSTMQQTPSTNVIPPSDHTFNSCGMYPNRAEIKICGDLNTMQDGWTPEERSAKRRLVRFSGEQSGSTINAYFRALSPDERPSASKPREKLVSCIYWEERDEYVITSVDTIALLETLVGARFQVDEKNRIRRNLETHHPLTVYKSKQDTESLFKVIMGFPNPKPRNIEKDVKVFPWPILARALGKVIGKYVGTQLIYELLLKLNLHRVRVLRHSVVRFLLHEHRISMSHILTAAQTTTLMPQPDLLRARLRILPT